MSRVPSVEAKRTWRRALSFARSRAAEESAGRSSAWLDRRVGRGNRSSTTHAHDALRRRGQGSTATAQRPGATATVSVCADYVSALAESPQAARQRLGGYEAAVAGALKTGHSALDSVRVPLRTHDACSEETVLAAALALHRLRHPRREIPALGDPEAESYVREAISALVAGELPSKPQYAEEQGEPTLAWWLERHRDLSG